MTDKYVRVGNRRFPLSGDYLSRSILRQALDYAQSIGGADVFLPAGYILIDYDLLKALREYMEKTP